MGIKGKTVIAFCRLVKEIVLKSRDIIVFKD